MKLNYSYFLEKSDNNSEQDWQDEEMEKIWDLIKKLQENNNSSYGKLIEGVQNTINSSRNKIFKNLLFNLI